MNQLLVLFLSTCLSAFANKSVEAVLPALAYENGCSSTIELRNLGEYPAIVEVEVHRNDGTLSGQAAIKLHLAPGETVRKQVEGAWVKLREIAVVAVQATVECHVGDTLRTAPREAAYPTRSPWFAGEAEGSILMINTSEYEATASLCYSNGAEFSLPGGPFQPVCTISSDIQVPPFGSRTFPARQGDNTHFELRTSGDGIVLQMLRPVAGSTRTFAVDSSISFASDTTRTAAQSNGSAESATPPHFP